MFCYCRKADEFLKMNAGIKQACSMTFELARIVAEGEAGGARPQLQPQLGDEPGDDAAAPRHSSILCHVTLSTTR